MDKPVKFGFIRDLRSLLDELINYIPLPKINPDLISAFSLILSPLVPISLIYEEIFSVLILALILFLDLLDGMVARKYDITSEEGYMIDVAVDRVSESIIFMVSIVPWFILFAVNSLLALVSFKKRRHFILPLRHIYLVYLVFITWDPSIISFFNFFIIVSLRVPL